MKTNSKEWWENEFKVNWEVGIDGKIQTELFADMAYGILSPHLKAEIDNLKGAFVDWGCALGQGCYNFLGNLTEKSSIIGIDFSKTAIEKAKKIYTDYEFYNDLKEVKKDIDLIFTSNTLEHFYNPEEEIKKLLDYTNKYLIILVPYMQEPTEVHHFKFTNEFFIYIANNYNAKIKQLTPVGVIDNLYSPTLQVLCVFEKY